MNKKILSTYLIFILVLSSTSFVSSNKIEEKDIFNVELTGINQEINLLKGEFYLYLNSIIQEIHLPTCLSYQSSF